VTGDAYRAAAAVEARRAKVEARRAKEAEEAAQQAQREDEILQQLQKQGLDEDEDDLLE
jgi:NAD(P)H-hydrate repair Nnr-like enzyme with NAD(P)H-hydrate epimerase domain